MIFHHRLLKGEQGFTILRTIEAGGLAGISRLLTPAIMENGDMVMRLMIDAETRIAELIRRKERPS